MSDRSSVVARLRQRITELESVRLRQSNAEQEAARLRQRINELDSKFAGGESIPVPDNSSSYVRDRVLRAPASSGSRPSSRSCRTSSGAVA